MVERMNGNQMMKDAQRILAEGLEGLEELLVRETHTASS
jgi:hypothetical protein